MNSRSPGPRIEFGKTPFFKVKLPRFFSVRWAGTAIPKELWFMYNTGAHLHIREEEAQTIFNILNFSYLKIHIVFHQAVRNYHKLSGLKQIVFSSGQKSD